MTRPAHNSRGSVRVVPAAPRALVAVIFWLVASFAVATASAQEGFDTFDPGLEDAAFLGVTIPLATALHAAHPLPTEREAHAPGFDRSFADALEWDNRGTADVLSDYGLNGLMLAGLIAPELGNLSFESESLRGSLVGIEALSATYLVTGLTKHVVRRLRPDHDTDNDDAYASFFSGHTSMTFASATLVTAYAHEYHWLDDGTRWVIPATAYTLAGLTGYLRMGARRHWFSDVLVGAIVGTSVTGLVVLARTD